MLFVILKEPVWEWLWASSSSEHVSDNGKVSTKKKKKKRSNTHFYTHSAEGLRCRINWGVTAVFPHECLLGTIPAEAKSYWVLLCLENRETSYTLYWLLQAVQAHWKWIVVLNCVPLMSLLRNIRCSSEISNRGPPVFYIKLLYPSLIVTHWPHKNAYKKSIMKLMN